MIMSLHERSIPLDSVHARKKKKKKKFRSYLFTGSESKKRELVVHAQVSNP